MNVLAVFRSRSEALGFKRLLDGKGIRARIVETPTSLGFSCGLSVQFDTKNMPFVKRVIGVMDYDSFVNFYK